MSDYLMDLRRNRLHASTRRLLAEVDLHPRQFIQPYFVYQGLKQSQELPSIRGQMKHHLPSLIRNVELGLNQGINSILLFFIPEKKCQAGSAFDHSFDSEVLVDLKKHFGNDVLIMTDLCLCSQTASGHCGILDQSGAINNQASVKVLAEKALVHAQAGSDVISPSDMMDGRIAAIRQVLNASGLDDKLIMSYSSKFSSNFYGPFRDAAESTPTSGDRKSYQIDYRNPSDAMRASLRDAEEGADILMVKPAGSYLDMLYRIKHHPDLCHYPLAAYQVSGEFQSLAVMAEKGLIDFEKGLLETLFALKRSGADLIISYAANQINELLKKHTGY